MVEMCDPRLLPGLDAFARAFWLWQNERSAKARMNANGAYVKYDNSRLKTLGKR